VPKLAVLELVSKLIKEDAEDLPVELADVATTGALLMRGGVETDPYKP
jgi:hypothetical protein